MRIAVTPAKAGAQFLILLAAVTQALAADATFTTKSLTPETALKAAQAALAKCRADGYQVAVAIVDRSGITQALIRDRFAGPHTIDVATNKAWSAVSFKTSTGDLARVSRTEAMAGLREFPRAVVVAGGQVIQGGGSLLGGIGVSGAPGGEADDACATAGIKAVSDDLEF